MNRVHEISSTCLSPETARRLVVDIEHLGVETNRIGIEAEPARTALETSSVDRAATARPAARAGTGAAIGLVVGLILGFLVGMAIDMAAITTVAIGVGAAIAGGLIGLYSRLEMSTELADVDTGQESRVRVDVTGLDPDTVAAIEHLVDRH